MRMSWSVSYLSSRLISSLKRSSVLAPGCSHAVGGFFFPPLRVS